MRIAMNIIACSALIAVILAIREVVVTPVELSEYQTVMMNMALWCTTGIALLLIHTSNNIKNK